MTENNIEIPARGRATRGYWGKMGDIYNTFNNNDFKKKKDPPGDDTSLSSCVFEIQIYTQLFIF